MPILLLSLALLVTGTVLASPLVLNSGTGQVTLLELYTSQGCSSCPPAERWLNGHVHRDDLWTRTVPVAFHVDYWDYIGWKDTFASEAHGERQREYARIGKARTVYTPALFTNGREWRGWTFGLNPRASPGDPGNLTATVTRDRLSAAFQDSNRPLDLHVALLGFGIETRVERGENRNSTLRQEFVVLAHEVHPSTGGHWDIPMPKAEPGLARRQAVAIWVSSSDSPVPIQATGGWLEQ